MAPLQVLTLNGWGLWLVSKRRYNRILHLAEYLANDAEQKHKLDLVLLQEVWVDEDARVLTSAAKVGGLPYAMHFQSGVFGSGLLTLSRYPITEAAFHQYTCAGDPASITCGDYLAAKGVGWTRIAAPGGPLDAFNTHLHANYSHKYGSSAAGGGEAPDAGGIPAPAIDEFAAFRMAQMLELCRFMEAVTRKAGSLGTVLAGDLNCGPHTLEVALLKSLLPELHDCWVAVRGAREAGNTCKAAGNSFKPRRQQPSRIDYVWSSLRVAACELALQHTPEGHSYSDHFAVHAKLELPSASATATSATATATATSATATSATAARKARLLRAAAGVVAGGVRRAAEASVGHIWFALIMGVQALCMCAFEPFMALLGRPINPALRPLLPVVVLLLAAGAMLFGLTGMVADAGQARSLQQAALQAELAARRAEEEAGLPGVGTEMGTWTGATAGKQGGKRR